MESFLSFLFVALLTIFFVRRYLKRIDNNRKPVRVEAPAAEGQACPRCRNPIPRNSAFCPRCGAPLAMWQVHRSAVQESGKPKTGKPKPVINASLCIGCGSCVDACPETGALAVINGKALLSSPEACTGHARCADVCPTSAITLAYDGVLQTMKVPLVNENFESNVEGLFIIGELGGMGLIKTAINEGKLVIEYLKQCVDRTGVEAASADDLDILIVGSGPAGLSAALSAHQCGFNYLVLEQGEIAATIRQYPRHKFLMSEPVSMPLYGNLYVADGSKETLLSVWETIISNTGVRINTNERVTNVKKDAGGFTVTSSKREYRARFVILAMGKRGTPRQLAVAGEQMSKVAYRLIEAESYENFDILVIGGGDSAIEAALALGRNRRNRVTLSYRGAGFERARQRNREKLKQAEDDGTVRVMRNSHVVSIGEKKVRLSCGGREGELPNDYVFALIGGQSPEEFLIRTGVQIVEKAVAAESFSFA